MPWNPETYNQFKSIRFQPFNDLMELIDSSGIQQALDLGCGTGEQTAVLAEKFPHCQFLGIDSSKEMLDKSMAFESERLKFRHTTTEEILSEPKQWDLIFSNAALQWSDHHYELFPKIITRLNTNGQLAVQMPYQPENKLNKLLFDLAEEYPYKSFLNGWNRPSPVLTMDDYTQLLFDNGLHEINLIQKVYPIVTTDYNTLYHFIAGSALIPYLERLEPSKSEIFVEAYKKKIQMHYPNFPAIYAFKRILMYGKKK